MEDLVPGAGCSDSGRPTCGCCWVVWSMQVDGLATKYMTCDTHVVEFGTVKQRVLTLFRRRLVAATG